MATEEDSTVAIVGAGPVGLLIALLLAQGGVSVTVYEAEETVSQAPRAIVCVESFFIRDTSSQRSMLTMLILWLAAV